IGTVGVMVPVVSTSVTLMVMNDLIFRMYPENSCMRWMKTSICYGALPSTRKHPDTPVVPCSILMAMVSQKLSIAMNGICISFAEQMELSLVSKLVYRAPTVNILS